MACFKTEALKLSLKAINKIKNIDVVKKIELTAQQESELFG